jgi:hypothetical protein
MTSAIYGRPVGIGHTLCHCVCGHAAVGRRVVPLEQFTIKLLWNECNDYNSLRSASSPDPHGQSEGMVPHQDGHLSWGKTSTHDCASTINMLACAITVGHNVVIGRGRETISGGSEQRGS